MIRFVGCICDYRGLDIVAFGGRIPASFTLVEYGGSFICTSHLKLVEHHLLVLAIRTFLFYL